MSSSSSAIPRGSGSDWPSVADWRAERRHNLPAAGSDTAGDQPSPGAVAGFGRHRAAAGGEEHLLQSAVGVVQRPADPRALRIRDDAEEGEVARLHADFYPAFDCWRPFASGCATRSRRCCPLFSADPRDRLFHGSDPNPTDSRRWAHLGCGFVPDPKGRLRQSYRRLPGSLAGRLPRPPRPDRARRFSAWIYTSGATAFPRAAEAAVLLPARSLRRCR